MRALELWWRRSVDADALGSLRFLEPALGIIHHLIRAGVRRPDTFSIPVVSVGSPLLGGSGKTPLTHWVAQQLSARVQVAIAGRGYRRVTKGHLLVSDGRGSLVDSRAAGDELLLLARRVPQSLVLANENRLEAIKKAAALGAQVVCLDDALQNQSVRKNLNLAVLHSDEGAQMPRLFPLGRLRVPLSEMADVDALVIICPAGTTHHQIQQMQRPFWMPDGLPTAVARLRHCGFLDALSHAPVAVQPGQRVAAWASIASPRRFFAALAQEGLTLTDARSEPDHHTPEPRALQRWALEQKARGACFLCCTEKDAMHPLPSLCLPVVYLRIELEFPLGDQLLIGLMEERVHDVIAHSFPA